MVRLFSSSGKRWAKILLTTLVVAVALFFVVDFLLPDGAFGALALALGHDQTVYAKGFSESRFRRIRLGMEEAEVRELLGDPMEESWTYRMRGPTEADSYLAFKEDRLTHVAIHDAQDHKLSKVAIGMRRSEVIAELGLPVRRIWFYTAQREKGDFRERKLIFNGERVVQKIARPYLD